MALSGLVTGAIGCGVACGVTGVSAPAGAVAVGVGVGVPVAVSTGEGSGATTTTVPFINGAWTWHSKR